MKMLARILALSALFLTTACTQAGLLAANAPAHFADVQVKQDIAYGALPQQKLDIYTPANAAGPLPVVVFFYGGGYSMGSRESYRFVGTALAQQGFTVVVPDYRQYPAVRFPAFVEDGAAAVAWTADNIAAYGGDASHLFVAGHSAGAHIGALVATNTSYLGAYHKKPRDVIKGFVGLAGPYAFTPDTDKYRDIFGPPEKYPQMQVPTFVTGHEPPMLLLWGEADTTVGRINLDKLEAAMRAKKGCLETKIYPGIDHAWIIGALSWMGHSKAPVLADMVNFFNNPTCGQ